MTHEIFRKLKISTYPSKTDFFMPYSLKRQRFLSLVLLHIHISLQLVCLYFLDQKHHLLFWEQGPRFPHSLSWLSCGRDLSFGKGKCLISHSSQSGT